MARKPRVRFKRGSTIAPPPAVPGFRARYDAAGTGRRAANWANARGEGPITAIAQDQDTLRRRCRHEFQNNPYGSRIADVVSGAVVGEGVKPNFRKLGDEAEQLQQWWNAWVEQADADEVVDLYGMQDLAMREIFAAGEVFVRGRRRAVPRTNDPAAMTRQEREDAFLVAPLQLQMLPGEMVPTTDHVNGAKSGIVFRGPGRRAAYRFLLQHPGESVGVNAAGSTEKDEVPADEVMHVFKPRRAGQIRGEPWLVRGLIPLSELDAFYDAALVRHKLNAMVTWWVETPNAGAAENAPASYDEDGTPLDENGDPWEPEDPVDLLPEVEPGAVLPLPPGYKATASAPQEVGGQFDIFTKRQMQRICAAVSVPYELVSEDTSGTNDRVLRVKLLHFHRLVRQWRGMLVSRFCRPTLRSFLEALEAAGRWSPSEGRTIDDYVRAVSWVGEPTIHIYPKQEIETDIAAIANVLKSPSQVIIERGGDPDTVFEQWAADMARMRDLGIAPEDLVARMSSQNPNSSEDEDGDD